MRKLNVSKNDIDMQLSANLNTIDGKITEAVVIYGGDLDYTKLKNKPTLNGKEIVGAMEEVDPGVPEWAKEPEIPVEPVSSDEVEKWLNGEDEGDS